MTGPAAEFIEREYNNRAACPDHPQWFARWAAESAAARTRLVAHLDLRYGSGARQTLDLFPATRPRGALLFIHGGYWRALDKSFHSFVAVPLVDEGIGVAVLNYDLCPQVGIARIVDECREAVAWLTREGAQHGVSCDRLVIAGNSAGGHLAAMMLATDWSVHNVDPDSIIAALAISGVFDLEPLLQTSLNTDLALDIAAARTLSPIRLAPKVRAPLLLAVGANETSEFRRQTQMMWDGWRDARPQGWTDPCEVPDRHHFSIVSDLGDAKSELSARIRAQFAG
ncbi:MAG: alpha/beta hydrolase [Casimicrobiaceae bacterium]